MGFINDIIDSLRTGSIYALIALAFTLGANICGLINFVNGELFIIGIYVVAFCCKLHIPFIFSVIISMAVCAFFNIIIEIYIYKPLFKRKKIHDLIVSIGLAFLIQNVFVLLFSSNPKNLPNMVSGEVKIGPFEVEYVVLISFLIAITLMFAICEFLRYTKLGKMIRAVSENSEATALMGINNDKIISFVFGICGILLACSGSLFCISFPVFDPYSGTMIGLRALVGAIIGGLGIVSGSIPRAVTGAIMGGFFIGIIETLVKSYISVQMSDIAIFLILSVYLLANRKKYV